MLYPFTKIAKFKSTGYSSQENAHACRVSTPRQGDIDIRFGVGVDCLL